MWLLVGLGNPGKKYQGNRHNVGFQVLDELAKRHAKEAFRDKFGGQVAGGMIQGQKVLLLKPMEFMNVSGFAVQRTAQFHAVPAERIVVIHDEKDIDLGRIKLKSGGGHGGHNGLRSIMEQLGSGKFARLRMGVGRDPKLPPGGGADGQAVAGWVLADFPKAHAGIVTAMIKAGCEDIQTVLAKGIGPAMNQHNARPNLSSPGTAA
jgi:PTH1 family peptidyl-tRNA hydrolase